METRERRDELFVEALRKHRDAMYRVALSMLHSPADAEDAVGEATLSAYAHIRQLKSWDAVRPWLMRITVNACYDVLRGRRHETPLDDAIMTGMPAPEREETAIWAYVQQLPPSYSVVLQMFYGEDMSLREICEALHMRKGTVSARMTRARQELKKRMEADER